jgi:hypothetical protein
MKMITATFVAVALAGLTYAQSLEQSTLQEKVPLTSVAFIEMGTGRCVATYESASEQLRTCLPVLSGETKTVSVSPGTELLDISDQIGMYLDAPSN